MRKQQRLKKEKERKQELNEDSTKIDIIRKIIETRNEVDKELEKIANTEKYPIKKKLKEAFPGVDDSKSEQQ